MASPSVIRAPFMASGPFPRSLLLSGMLSVLVLLSPAAGEETPKAAQESYAHARSLAEAGQAEEALDALATAFDLGYADNQAPRLDPAFSTILTDPRFRELLDAHTSSSSSILTSSDEPGERLRVLGFVRDPAGQPIEGALVFAHQADATGLYNFDGGPDPRLFGSVRTGADGTFELSTIRPASYPDSRIPQHVHLRARADGYRERVFELLFADDPFRSGSSSRNVVGTPSAPDEGAVRSVECPIVLQPATP